MKKLITERQAAEILGISRQAVSYLRLGMTKNKNGKNYEYPPVFTLNKEYIWEKGRVYYYESVILKHKKTMRRVRHD